MRHIEGCAQHVRTIRVYVSFVCMSVLFMTDESLICVFVVCLRYVHVYVIRRSGVWRDGPLTLDYHHNNLQPHVLAKQLTLFICHIPQLPSNWSLVSSVLSLRMLMSTDAPGSYESPVITMEFQTSPFKLQPIHPTE